MNAEVTENASSTTGLATTQPPASASISQRKALCFAAIAASAFHASFAFPAFGWLILVYVYSMITLSALPTKRLAFRYGFITGLAVFAPQLYWFWNIFGLTAICLWAVLSFFTGAFVLSLHLWRNRFSTGTLWLAAPIFWTAFEYFRGELYYLRFPWLSVGSAFSGQIGMLPVGTLGIYGVGFALFLIAGIVYSLPGNHSRSGGAKLLLSLFTEKFSPPLQPRDGPFAQTTNKGEGRFASSRKVLISLFVLTSLALLIHLPAPTPQPPVNSVEVAGIQLEFPPELQIPEFLDRVIAKHPDAQILVLSEYTLDGPVPKRITDWCRTNERYLIVGGRDDSIGGGQFYNTAFVVDPNGEIVFKQAKSVPIQFFKDGLPAPSQQIWQSPWGRIAMSVCYDLSYRRVMDRFIAQGAQALIIPFMDLVEWGEHQHRLHARVAPLRAREYGLSIFRLGSSGVSQHVESTGKILDAAPFPGQEQILSATLHFQEKPSIPLDAWLAPASVAAATLLIILLFFMKRPYL